jgi:mRNA-degrading endonuclease RelE of RelBE toxin-antitoxin system
MFSFVVTPLFSKLVEEYLSDDEYRRLQQALIDARDSGAVIRGSGGVRKLSWAAPGRGKRGGCRVIYYLRKPKRRCLDADDVSEECSRPHSDARIETDSRRN